MKKQDVISYFGTQQKVADALTAAGSQITQRAVSAWGEVIPIDRAFVVERITEGNLRVDLSMYPKMGGTEVRAQ